MATLLSDAEIQDKLKTIPGWQREGDEIRRKFSLLTFTDALVFASAVGLLAEAADHHPDILIQWRHVTLTLSTHSAKGLTERDFSLAQQIDSLPLKSG